MSGERGVELTETGLYLEPSTLCPLSCSLCYTAHREQRLLSEEIILRAIELMLKEGEDLGVFWCGLGEVYADERFPGLLRAADETFPGRLLHMVQTNGQYPHQAPDPAPTNKIFLVSLDLPRRLHEAHRGPGTWRPAVEFMARQLAGGALGVGVKSLVTPESAPLLAEEFRALKAELASTAGGAAVEERVHLEPVIPFPRGAIERRDNPAFTGGGAPWDSAVTVDLLERHLPGYRPRRLRTAQVSVTSLGVFTCCEAVVKVAELHDLLTLDRASLLDLVRKSLHRCDACGLRRWC